MKKFKFEKKCCERYDIELEDRTGWAIIVISEDAGIFNAQSDFGNYSYSWPNHGRKSFKHFILELVNDKSYFLGKISDSNYYYPEETKKAWKEEIIRARRYGELNNEEARELWNEIINFDYTSCEHLQHESYQSHVIAKYYCEPWHSFDIVCGFPPEANAFADVIMPVLGEIIQSELNE